MSRILGVDIGERRIGLAISDETRTIARGLGSITVGSFNDTISRIKDIISRYKIEAVIVGLPLNMNGSIGPQAKKAINFADRLKKNLSAAVSTFDERLTTKQGEAILLQADMSRKKRRLKIDSMAAQIMLQSYLDSNRQKKGGGLTLV